MVRVALAHDYLTQRGGAERVALQLASVFPGSTLYTSVFEPSQTFPEFSSIDVRTSWLQHSRLARRDPRVVFPAVLAAWSMTHVKDADIVLASSTGFAHGVQVARGVRKVVYCHNPARWLYQTAEYLPGRHAQRAFSVVRPWLRQWDERAALSADLYLVNSTSVQRRVFDAYGINAQVLHPPVLIDTSASREPVPGVEPGFWLAIARGRGYKNVQSVADAVSSLKGERLIIAGSGAFAIDPRPNVTSVGIVTDSQLRWLYANARALVSVSFEDFGLTPIEANAYGTPVAVLRAGGFVDTTLEGVSGVFIEDPTAAAVADVLFRFPQFDKDRVRANSDRFLPSSFAAALRRIVTDPRPHQSSSTL